MNINLNTWFGQRELCFCPKHFIKCASPLTDNSKFWVYENLKGRFYIKKDVTDFLSFDEEYIYFEDPQDVIMYELTWS